MQRDIRFRAWNTESNKMFEVNVIADNKGYANHRDFEDGVPTSSILMQWIGAKDKNGKDIYEGDIVKYWGGMDKIAFDDGWFGIYHTESDIFYCDGKEVEVIGNIYNNPDLLNAKTNSNTTTETSQKA